MYLPVDKVTERGIDMQFGTNVLGESRILFSTSHSQAHTGHFYLTRLLLPLLLATAKKSPAGSVRVVNLSSMAHNRAAPEGIRWSSLLNGNGSLGARKELGTTRLYGQSKLVKAMPPQLILTRYLINPLFLQGNILFSNELARRYGGEGIVSISLNPGAIKTGLTRHLGLFLQVVGRLVGLLILYSVSYGAISSLYAGTASAAGELNGKVSIPASRILCCTNLYSSV
jgi:retinol dehydrogenase-12